MLSAVFSVLTFLGLRFVLTYLGANQGAGFSRFSGVSEAFYLPFRAVVPNGSDGAGHPIAWSISSRSSRTPCPRRPPLARAQGRAR